MRRRALWLFALCLLVLGNSASLPGERSKTTPRGTAIIPDTIPLKPGGGLSLRTPVVRPVAIKSVRSWTIETRRHRWAAVDLAVSPDGTLVATSGYDGMIRLWNAQTGELKRVFVGHDSYVYGLAWSADGRYLASAGVFDSTVRVWETNTGLPVKVLRGSKDAPVVVAWSPDGSLLAAGTINSGNVPIWQAATGKLLRTAEVGKTVTSLAFAPDGRTLACGVFEVGVHLLAAPDWKAAQKIDLPGQSPRDLSFSADGKQLAFVGSKEALVWDLATKKVLHRLEGPFTALARHGNRLALAGTAGRIWEPPLKPAPAPVLTGQALAWSPDGKAIYQLYGDEVVAASPADSKVLKRWSVAESGQVSWYPGRPILTGIGTLEPRLWATTTGKLLHTLKGHKAGTTTTAWSPGGKVLVTAGYDRTARVWNPTTGTLLRTLTSFETAVTALAVAGDGKIAAGSADGKVRVFAAEGTKVLRVYSAHGEAVKALAWGRDGRLASGGVDAVVRIWGTDTVKPFRSLEHAGSVECLAFSPSGKWLAAGSSDNRVHVWSYPSGKLVHEFSELGSPPAVSALAWSSDSIWLHVGRANHTVQLWNVTQGKKPHQSFIVMAPVHSVAWSAGNKTLVSCTIDRSARFWNAATGQLQATLMAEKDQLCCVAAEGHYRVPSEADTELVCVVLTAKGMETYTPKEFAARFGWKNDPARARMVGR
jgi:WD40 repeat protein